MKWTRRRFLEASAAAPVLAPVAAGLVTSIDAAPPNPLSEPERDALNAAMDQIIPAGDGMPSASQAGGMEYLERLMQQQSEIASEIRSLLTELKDHGTLAAFDAKDPQKFARLRDYIYEGYYTQPEIWNLVGYRDYPTDHAGPHMQPFDESILAPVRGKPKFYREA